MRKRRKKNRIECSCGVTFPTEPAAARHRREFPFLCRRVTLSQVQRPVLQFLADGHAPFLHYYPGPPGTTGRGSFFWRQYNRRKIRSGNLPSCHGKSIEGLIKREMLEYRDDGDYAITQKGREALK